MTARDGMIFTSMSLLDIRAGHCAGRGFLELQCHFGAVVQLQHQGPIELSRMSTTLGPHAFDGRVRRAARPSSSLGRP